MSASSVTAESSAEQSPAEESGGHAPELTSTCRLCPPDGGTVIARFPGEGPAWRAAQRAAEETDRTGAPHHDHYDPELDAFLVIRHACALPQPRQAS
jgi:hypothetical protein